MKQGLINVLKVFLVLTGSVGALWGAFTMYHNLTDGLEGVKQQLVEVKQQVGNGNATTDSVLVLTQENKQAIILQNDQFLSLEKSFKFYRNNVDKIDKSQMEQIIIDAYGLGLEEGKKKEVIP